MTEKQREYQRNRNQKLREMHLCQRCKKQDERTLSGKVFCTECANEDSTRKRYGEPWRKALRRDPKPRIRKFEVPAQEESAPTVFQTPTDGLIDGTREWKADIYRMLENFRKQNGPGCFKALEQHNTGLTANCIWTIYTRDYKPTWNELRVLRWCLTGFQGHKPSPVGVLLNMPDGWQRIVAAYNNGQISRSQAIDELHITPTTFSRKIRAEWSEIR